MVWFLTQCQAWGPYLPALTGLCLHHTGDYPLPVRLQGGRLRLPGNGETLGGGSSPPGLLSMSGGNTNIVSETARPACPSVCLGLEALPEEGMKEGRGGHPLLSTYCIPGPILDILHELSPCEVESFFLL